MSPQQITDVYKRQVLNQSVFNAVKQLKRENPRTRFYNTAPVRPEEEPFICNGVQADGYIYGLPVHTANAEFKDWVLKDGYQEMKILNEKHQTIPLPVSYTHLVIVKDPVFDSVTSILLAA